MLFYGFGTNPGYKLQEYQKTQLMQVKPNTKSVMQISSSPKCYICEIDKDFTVVKFTKLPITYNKQEYKFTTTANTKYISLRLGIQDSNYTSYEFTDIQLEQNEEATDVVEHQEYEQVTYIDKQLCGIGNVRDELDYTNKKIIRRCGEITFDGINNKFTTKGDKFNTYATSAITGIKKATSNNEIVNCLSNMFTAKSTNEIYNNGIIGIAINQYGQVWIGLDENSEIDTLDKLNAKLAETPLELVYPLATEIVEDIDCSDKITQYDEQTTVYNTDNAEIEVSLTNNKAIAEVNENLDKIEENTSIKKIKGTIVYVVNSNANEMKTPGTYRVAGENITNYPDTRGGIVDVSGNEEFAIEQIFTMYNGKKWNRICWYGTWYDWLPMN